MGVCEVLGAIRWRFDTWLDSLSVDVRSILRGAAKKRGEIRRAVYACAHAHARAGSDEVGWRLAADRRRGKPAQDETRMTGGQRTRIHNDTPSSEQACCPVLLVKASGHSRAELHPPLAKLAQSLSFSLSKMWPRLIKNYAAKSILRLPLKIQSSERQPCFTLRSFSFGHFARVRSRTSRIYYFAGCKFTFHLVYNSRRRRRFRAYVIVRLRVARFFFRTTFTIFRILSLSRYDCDKIIDRRLCLSNELRALS